VAIQNANAHEAGIGPNLGGLAPDWEDGGANEPTSTIGRHFCGISDIHEVRFQPTVLTADPAGDRSTAHRAAQQVAQEFADSASAAA
jgi:hypothetical protein